jgi:hypothetical protein
VVQLVFEHARTRPRTSLAVVTASLRHAARIGESIRLQLPNHPGLAGFFGAGPESFRVVDLERAQGLVRDHVIFSPGFGRTPHGRALHNFGPLSAEGGREKFALAMTRARRSIHVLTCFRPEDLDHTRLTHGAVDLYSLLDREIAGNTDLGTPASRAAASEQALGADPLVADLGDRLRARGARVWHQYDGAIDVVAAADPLSTMGRDETDLPWPVAIESDGTEQYRTMSVRERSRLRPQLLERLGWRYMPLWTIEVFTDPSACADRIAGYLGLERVVLPGRTASSTGFLDDDVDQALNGIDAGEQARRRPQDKDLDSKEVVPVAPEETGSADGQSVPVDPAPEDEQDQEQGKGQGQDGSQGILPTKASEDDPRRWGDVDDDHDAWLKEQKPPHWG